MTYSVTAAFDAVDNISNIADNIGKNLAGMEDKAIAALRNLSENGFDVASAATAGLSAATDIAIGFLASAIDDMAVLEEAGNRYAATTNASADAVDAFKKQSQDLFASGLVDNMKQAADIAGEVDRKMKGVANFDAATFEKNIAGVAKAWDTDGTKLVDKTVEISNKFDDLKGKPQLVLDALVVMAQNSGLPIDDLAAKIDKFGTKFAGAGLTGFLAMSLINSAIMAGVTDDGLGKLSTALDKLHNNFLNPPKGFQEAMEKLGLPDIVKQVQTNQIPIQTAYSEIFAKLGTIKDQAVQAEIFTTLFGKAAAGAITPDMLAKMAGFANSLGGENGVAGAAAKVASMMQDDGTLGTAIKNFGQSFKVQVEQGLQDYYDMITKTDWAAAWKGFDEKFHSNTTNITATLADWNKQITDFLNKLAEAITKGFGGGGASGGGTGGLHAAGGTLDPGWNVVGEQGPELLFNKSGSGEVFSNKQSKQMIAGMSGGGGSGGAQVSISGNTFVGTGGLQELARIITPYLQGESQRRVERT